MVDKAIIPADRIEQSILLIRKQKVMLDADLAALYGVETKVLVQAVKRNIERFPQDFMFQLNDEEASLLRSQFVTLEKGRGKYSKYRPYAFTEQGIAMLSSVLRSPQAIQVNIEIMRAFIKLRQILATHAALAKKLSELENKYDAQFREVFKAIRALVTPPETPKRKIGFSIKEKKAKYRAIST
jgi:hypothetical protein